MIYIYIYKFLHCLYEFRNSATGNARTNVTEFHQHGASPSLAARVSPSSIDVAPPSPIDTRTPSPVNSAPLPPASTPNSKSPLLRTTGVGQEAGVGFQPVVVSPRNRLSPLPPGGRRVVRDDCTVSPLRRSVDVSQSAAADDLWRHRATPSPRSIAASSDYVLSGSLDVNASRGTDVTFSPISYCGRSSGGLRTSLEPSVVDIYGPVAIGNTSSYVPVVDGDASPYFTGEHGNDASYSPVTSNSKLPLTVSAFRPIEATPSTGFKSTPAERLGTSDPPCNLISEMV